MSGGHAGKKKKFFFTLIILLFVRRIKFTKKKKNECKRFDGVGVRECCARESRVRASRGGRATEMMMMRLTRARAAEL